MPKQLENETQALLNRYGLTLGDPDYEDRFFYRMERLESLVMSSPFKEGPHKVMQEKILRAFAWEAKGIYVDDLEKFKRIFEVGKMAEKIPSGVYELLELYAHSNPNQLNEPFGFYMKPYNEYVLIIRKLLREKEGSIKVLLKENQLRNVFKSGKDQETEFAAIQKTCERFSSALNQSAVKQKMTEELMDHLWEKFYPERGNLDWR